MSRPDPRSLPVFVTSIHGAAGAGKSTLARALLDFPTASETDLARIDIVDGDDASKPSQAALLVVRGLPTDAHRADLAALDARHANVLVAVHARDLDPASDDALREAWAAVASADRVHLTATPEGGDGRGIDALRAAIFALALAGVDVSVSQARRAKRPYAASIIVGAALTTAAEALLPGAAALVVASQIGAIGALSYLYTGKWAGRTQTLSLLPVFASEAAGGSIFLVVKSFLPPTGVADAAAATVAATLTIAMLGAVAWALEQGYSLDQKDQLRDAFRRLRARSVAERAELLKNRARWRDRSFWSELVQRVLFES